MTPRDILSAYMQANPDATQLEVAETFGISQATVNRLLNDKPNVRQSTIEIIRLNALRIGLLPSGEGGFHNASVPIVGVVGMGEAIEWVDDESAPLGEVSVPFSLADGCFALEAQGDSQFPRIRNGDLVIVRRVNVISEVLYEEAVVKIVDGAYVLKTVLPGYEPGTFNLESHNAPLKANVCIERAFAVEAIIPRRRWTRS